VPVAEGHCEAPVWNPGLKIEIPHPENHVLKVFRFRSWKPRVWKSRPQSWDPKSWKPCPENIQGPRFQDLVLSVRRSPETKIGTWTDGQTHCCNYICNVWRIEGDQFLCQRQFHEIRFLLLSKRFTIKSWSPGEGSAVGCSLYFLCYRFLW